MKKISEYFILFLTGATVYPFIEILFRGYTHWSMSIAGGLALIALYPLNIRFHAIPVFLRCLLGSYIITVIEFMTGYTVNIIYHMNVWDYSEQPFNILGQICPLFTFFWFLLCFPGGYLCKAINKLLKKENTKLIL